MGIFTRTPKSAPGLSDLQPFTDVLEKEDTRHSNEEGDHEKFAHYVQKEKIVESAVTGKPVIALCGKVWVPGRDPGKFPICPDCKKIFDSLK
jgi:hypothetical protein